MSIGDAVLSLGGGSQLTRSERPREMPAVHAHLLRRRLNSKLVCGAADVMSELLTQAAKSKRRGRF